MALKERFKKNLVATYMTSKGLALELKLANCSWIITKWDDITVTGKFLTKNRQIVRYI